MNTDLSTLLTNYKPSSLASEIVSTTPVVLLVGPTGAGKDSVKDQLLAEGGYHHIISHTSRPPRINHGILEQDGREYHFIDLEIAAQMLRDQAFIEAKVFSGNLYGTSVAEIQKAHEDDKIALTDVEVQGVAEYKQLDEHVMAVFLLPPDFNEWQARLQRRYGDVVDADDYHARLDTALAELDQLLEHDYYIPIVNEDLEQTVAHVRKIVAARGQTEADREAAHAVAVQLSADIKAYLETI